MVGGRRRGWLGSARVCAAHTTHPSPPLQSKKNTPARLELYKYNKYLKKHSLHKEIK